MAEDGDPRRWGHLQHPIHRGCWRVCLFSRKNRSFVTGAPIYISSPQRLRAVTNVLGPRIPSLASAVSVARISSAFGPFPFAEATRIGRCGMLIGPVAQAQRLTLRVVASGRPISSNASRLPLLEHVPSPPVYSQYSLPVY